MLDGESSIEEEAKSNARMELHSDEQHELMRRTANMVLAAVRGLLEVMEHSAASVIEHEKQGNRFRLWSDCGKLSLGAIVYFVTRWHYSMCKLYRPSPALVSWRRRSRS